MSLIPMVVDNSSSGERVYDIYSLLLKERIIFLHSAINDQVSSVICAQLLYLSSIDSKKDINLYINSPGGVVTSGLAIYDTMNYISNDVSTICMGQAASMGAFLLAAGKKGKRKMLCNARAMIHQPLGGMQGQASDIAIHAKEILDIKKKLNEILAENTGNKVSIIEKNVDRDNFMTAEEAKAFGLIDEIL